MDKRIHFVGVAGSGVSALAQFHRMGGGEASGSDRSFDRGLAGELKRRLEALGVEILPQDGSFIEKRPKLVVASAAVEAGNADLERARQAGLEVVHRADFLAGLAEAHRTIAVAGTSGKSTVAAMIFEILEAGAKSPSVITGGALRSLEARGVVGNAWRGESGLLIIEADESDGTLVRYKPWLGVLLNVSKDHKEVAEVLKLFAEFRSRSAEVLIEESLEARLTGGKAPSQGAAPVPRAAPEGGARFGGLKAEGLSLEPFASRFSLSGVEFRLPVPGEHNVANALAAVAACLKAGVDLETAARGLAGFQGVARRFEVVGRAGEAVVVDDFAHNPAKVEAVLNHARRLGAVHAVFQFHGYGPAKFLRSDFIESFVGSLGPKDTLWLPEIYYAGGTADRSVSAKEVADAVAARGVAARYFSDREALVPELVRAVRGASGPQVVLVLGARDPTLSDFARKILFSLQA